MNEHGRGWTRMTGRGVGRTASLLSLALIAWWVIAANLGCGGPPLPSIELDPAEVRITEPGQTGTVFATLQRDGKPFQAEQWSISRRPRILAGAVLHPPDGFYTNIAWAATNDVELFGWMHNVLFLANPSRTTYLPIEAEYRLEDDPQHDRGRVANATLKVRMSVPRIRPVLIRASRTGTAERHIECLFFLDVENRWENATYEYRVFFRAQAVHEDRVHHGAQFEGWRSVPSDALDFCTIGHVPLHDTIRSLVLTIAWQVTHQDIVLWGFERIEVVPKVLWE